MNLGIKREMLGDIFVKDKDSEELSLSKKGKLNCRVRIYR